MTESLVEIGVTPQAVAAYLGSTGWALVLDDDTRQNWVSDDPRRAQAALLLPKDPSYDDYNDVFTRALRRLERLYDWDAQELYTHILSARSDVLYIRADQYTTDGTIPIREAQQLLDGAVDMVTAAARWTLTPRSAFGGRVPEVVKDFVDDDLRMGHTQRGSFVITVLTRLDSPPEIEMEGRTTKPPVASETALQGHAELTGGVIAPFQRQVMTSLALGLTWAKRATDDARRTQAGTAVVDMDDAVRHGVSAQLCEALGDMTSQAGVQALDLSFSWALAEPTPPPRVEHVVFDQPAVPVLREMRERLVRQLPPPRRTSVLGYVTRLERGADAEEGTITVVGHADNGQERQVRVPLTGTAYALAVQAHEAKQVVEATGDMVREGNAYVLRGRPTVRRLSQAIEPDA